MSEKPSEYLKRTCLICGCHTNQTINIYEPRSGPNIVQLIQAKFKFQPLNEDKYLCFSCNNWLINWHSLQAMNSNDAESPSGTFRSSLNNVMSEKGSGASKQDIFSLNQRHRPVAQIRPQQLQTMTESSSIELATSAPPPAPSSSSSPPSLDSKRKGLKSYSKRNFLSCQKIKKTIRRVKRCMQTCCMCGRSIVVLLSANRTPALNRKTAASAKCRKCRDISKWRSMYLKSIMREERNEQKRFKNCEQAEESKKKSSSGISPSSYPAQKISVSSSAAVAATAAYQSHRYQRPLVDGKVVSMLRRLGTTLSRESIIVGDHYHDHVPPFPQIMSPAKKKPLWSRELDDDEILIDFDSTIMEVLPVLQPQPHQQQHTNKEGAPRKQSRRKLMYQETEINRNESEEEVHELSTDSEDSGENSEWLDLAHTIPKGLSVSLINTNEDSICY